MEELKLPEGSRWTILRRAEDYIYPKSGHHSVRYECRCTCGTVNLDDLDPCPEGMELERKDVTLGYCPENCCWASELRQAQNRGKFSNNTSGFTGVAWSKDHNKWRVYLHRNKKKIEGGLHSTIESAIAKRRELEQLYPMEEV